jgi:hypothetical protein
MEYFFSIKWLNIKEYIACRRINCVAAMEMRNTHVKLSIDWRIKLVIGNGEGGSKIITVRVCIAAEG